MIEVRRTNVFVEWLAELRDANGKARIVARLERAEEGNLGIVAPVGEGISEMKINVGPGYRLYFKRRGQTIIVLLCGGDKSTQRSDIAKAKAIAAEL